MTLKKLIDDLADTENARMSLVEKAQEMNVKICRGVKYQVQCYGLESLTKAAKAVDEKITYESRFDDSFYSATASFEHKGVKFVTMIVKKEG